MNLIENGSRRRATRSTRPTPSRSRAGSRRSRASARSATGCRSARSAPRHRERILAHLLALDERSRYLRFGYAANDGHIARYVDTLDFEHDEVFGIFNRRLELIAMAHLAYRPADAGARPRRRRRVRRLGAAARRGAAASAGACSSTPCCTRATAASRPSSSMR